MHNSLEPVYSKSDLDNIDYEIIKSLSCEIINFSLKHIDLNTNDDFSINKAIYDYEHSLFKINKDVSKLIDNTIDYKSIIKILPTDKALPPNLKWLKALATGKNPINLRKIEAYKFPIELVVLAEGATEETLLPEFAKLCNYDFNKEGIHLIPAGGKNQVVKLYYELSEILKVPIYTLLDKDGEENAKEILPKLRSTDKIHILKCGEFEDLVSDELFFRSLNYALKNISSPIEAYDCNKSRVKNLEDIFKKRGMHEFKKVEFAQIVKKNILSATDISPETSEIIDEIKALKTF